jgi:hypothetical protein
LIVSGRLPIDREARLGAQREPVGEGVGEVEYAVHLVRVPAVSAGLEPLLHEAVGDEVLAEQRGSDIRADLPGVLAELALDAVGNTNVGPAPTMSRPPNSGRAAATPKTVSPSPAVRSLCPF